jgi:DDE family transposase
LSTSHAFFPFESLGRAKRKHTPEPVFGIIKSVLGFRQFLLRGLEKVKAEWTLVTLARNMKGMFVLKAA